MFFTRVIDVTCTLPRHLWHLHVAQLHHVASLYLDIGSSLLASQMCRTLLLEPPCFHDMTSGTLLANASDMLHLVQNP